MGYLESKSRLSEYKANILILVLYLYTEKCKYKFYV